MSLPLLGMRKNTWPFSPQSLPNCVCWLDAADTSSYNPESVTTWRNKVVYGSTPANATYTNIGIIDSSVKVNNLNVLRVLSNNNNELPQFMLPTITYTQTTRTIFYLINSYPTDTEFRYHAYTSNLSETPSFNFNYNNNTNFFDFSDVYGNKMSSYLVLLTTSILCITTNVGFFVDGILNSTSFTNTITLGTGPSSSQAIGSSQTLGGGIVEGMNIGDFLIFDGALTDTERQQVEGYLANKWGIQSQLPAAHPYYAADPTTILRPPNNRTFQPVDISGCQLWLDAADSSSIIGNPVTAIGNPVTAWTDKSGNGNNTTIRGTPTLATVSGNQYMNLNGSAGFNGSISITGNTVSTFAVIIIPANATNSARIVSLGVTNNVDWQSLSYVLLYLPGTADIRTFRNNTIIATISNYASTTIPRITGFIYDNANGYVYRNGSSLSGTSSGTFAISAYGVGINARYTDGEYFTGYVGEVIVYNTAVTNSQRLQIEAYLAQKWGVQSDLPSTPPHPGRFLPSFSTQFTPKTLGPALWLDAADASTLTIPSGSVTAWADKSGSNYSAVPYSGDSGSVTVSTTNGRQSVVLYLKRMYINNFNLSNAATLFVVCTYTVAGQFSMTDSITNYPGYNKWYFETNNWQLYALLSGFNTIDTNYAQGANVHPTNTLGMLCLGYNLGTTLSHYTVNGTSRVAALSSSSTTTAGSQTGVYIINGVTGGSSGGTLTVNELIHYNRSLTVNERQQVEGYLAWKWGTQGSLPSTHPYAKFQP